MESHLRIDMLGWFICWSPVAGDQALFRWGWQMHRLGLALTFGILVAGTAAQAQVTDVTGTSHASVSLDGTQQFDAPGTFSQGKNGSTVSPSFDLSNPASISFDSG